jgi:hypothetical protein
MYPVSRHNIRWAHIVLDLGWRWRGRWWGIWLRRRGWSRVYRDCIWTLWWLLAVWGRGTCVLEFVLAFLRNPGLDGEPAHKISNAELLMLPSTAGHVPSVILSVQRRVFLFFRQSLSIVSIDVSMLWIASSTHVRLTGHIHWSALRSCRTDQYSNQWPENPPEQTSCNPSV